MYTDLPKSTSNEDQLDRYQFAEQIAVGLTRSFPNESDSLVIGINGAWGYGKTTLLNFLAHEITAKHIHADEQMLIKFWFNPWMFSGQEDLQLIFLKELYAEVKEADEVIDLASLLDDLIKSHEYTHHPVTPPTTGLFKKTKVQSFKSLKERINEFLVENNIKLYIFIDDIDRLTPSETTQIFQLVKLNVNFKNTVFIVAFDREVVTGILVDQYGESGKRYLDKIIQADYKLPKISAEKIEKLFFDKLNDFLSSVSIPLDENSFKAKWNECMVRYFTSLRAIGRYMNAVRLNLPGIHEEINIEDFLILESIRVFDQSAYEYIFENRWEFREDTVKSEGLRAKLLDLFSETSVDVIFQLFNMGHMTYYPGDLSHMNASNAEKRKTVASKSKSIRHPDYFDRYFTLQLSTHDIKEECYNKFISVSIPVAEKVEMLRCMDEKKLFSRFITRVLILNLSEQQKAGVLETLLNYGRYLPCPNFNEENIRVNKFYTAWDLIRTLAFSMDRKTVLESLLDDKIPVNYFHYSTLWALHQLTALSAAKEPDYSILRNNNFYDVFNAEFLQQNTDKISGGYRRVLERSYLDLQSSLMDDKYSNYQKEILSNDYTKEFGGDQKQV